MAEDKYKFKGKEYTYADLESKYGDRTSEAIESFGIKKKSQTQPSSETATTTAEESVSEAPSTSTEEVTQPVVQETAVQETEPTQPTKPLDPYYQEKGQEAVESFTPQYGLDQTKQEIPNNETVQADSEQAIEDFQETGKVDVGYKFDTSATPQTSETTTTQGSQQGDPNAPDILQKKELKTEQDFYKSPFADTRKPLYARTSRDGSDMFFDENVLDEKEKKIKEVKSDIEYRRQRNLKTENQEAELDKAYEGVFELREKKREIEDQYNKDLIEFSNAEMEKTSNAISEFEPVFTEKAEALKQTSRSLLASGALEVENGFYKFKNQEDLDAYKAQSNDLQKEAVILDMLYKDQQIVSGISSTADYNKIREETVGEWDGLMNAWTRGLNSGSMTYELFSQDLYGKDIKEVAKEIALKNAENQGLLTSEGYQKFTEADDLDEALAALGQNPLEISSQLFTESMTMLLSAGRYIIPTTVATGVATGAAVGASGLGVGVIPGAITGFGYGLNTGMSTAGFTLEYYGMILEEMGKSGLDIANPEDVEKGLMDEELMDRAKKVGASRGVPILLVDLLSNGIAGRVTNVGKIGLSTTQRAGRIGAELAIQSGAEGFGEYVAQVSAGIFSGEGIHIEGKEILAEIAGGWGSSVPQGMVNIAADKANKVADVSEIVYGDANKRYSTLEGNGFDANILYDKIDKAVVKNEITEKAAEEAKSKIVQDVEVLNSIPETVSTPENKKKAFELLSERAELSKQNKTLTGDAISKIDEKLQKIAEDEAKPKEAPQPTISKNSTPTDEDYGTVNLNDGTGIKKVTKEEYEAYEKQLQGDQESTDAPTTEEITKREEGEPTTTTEPTTGVEPSVEQTEIGDYSAEEGTKVKIETGKSAQVSERMNNKELINEAEMTEASDELYTMLDDVDKRTDISEESKERIKSKIESEIDKIEGYEFETETKTSTTTQEGAIKGSRIIGKEKRKGGSKSQVTADRFDGAVVDVIDPETGETSTTIASVNDSGGIDVTTDKGEIIPMDTGTLQYSESKIDADGNLSVVLEDVRDGKKYEIKDNELALDISIKEKEKELGPIEDAILEEVLEDVTTTTSEEVLKEKAPRPVKEETKPVAETKKEEKPVAEKKEELTQITDDNVKDSTPDAIQSSSGFVYVRNPDGSYTDGDVTYNSLEEALKAERESTGDTNPIVEYSGDRIAEIRENLEEAPKAETKPTGPITLESEVESEISRLENSRKRYKEEGNTILENSEAKFIAELKEDPIKYFKRSIESYKTLIAEYKRDGKDFSFFEERLKIEEEAIGVKPTDSKDIQPAAVDQTREEAVKKRSVEEEISSLEESIIYEKNNENEKPWIKALEKKIKLLKRDPIKYWENEIKEAKEEIAKNEKYRNKLDEEFGEGYTDMLNERENDKIKEAQENIDVFVKKTDKTSITKDNLADIEAVENRTTDPVKKKAIGAIKNVIKALVGVDPNVVVNTYENQQEYENAIVNAGGSTKEARSSGFFEDETGEIHLNVPMLEDNTLFHEATHKVIKSYLKRSPKAVEVFEEQLRKSIPKSLTEDLDDFTSYYSKDERAEEFVTEFVARVASGEIALDNIPKSTLQKIIDAFKNLARKAGLPLTSIKLNNKEDVLEFANKLDQAFNEGRKLKIAKAPEKMNSDSNGEMGSVIVPSPVKTQISRESIKNSIDNFFDTTIEYDDSNIPDNVNMPPKESIDKVLEKSGGAAVFINSDGTKVGVNRHGESLQGGWRYTYLVENQKNNAGFAATSTSHVGTMHDISSEITRVRDEKNPTHKGKPVAVFVTVQNADTMLGEWYAGEFFMDGIDKALTDKKIKGGVRSVRKLLRDAINDSAIANKKGAKELIKLINSEAFNTHSGRVKIAKKFASKDFSFGFRVGLLKGLIPLKSATGGKNREIKKALLDVGYGRKDLYNEHMDEVLLDKLKKSGKTGWEESSIGGVTMGGFYMDPYASKSDFIENRNNGVDHAQFNESFSSNGETFALDNVHNVNDLSPEMGFPTKHGYELYNKNNGTNLTKENATTEDRFKIAEYLVKETNNDGKFIAPPFTSIAGTMYTSTTSKEDVSTGKEKRTIAAQKYRDRMLSKPGVRGSTARGGKVDVAKAREKFVRQKTDDMMSKFTDLDRATLEREFGKEFDKKGSKDVSKKNRIKFQIIGKNAQLKQNVRDNLQVARDMEDTGEGEKSIRRATGWEKGADGKWRYEIGDPTSFNMENWSPVESLTEMMEYKNVVAKNKLIQRFLRNHNSGNQKVTQRTIDDFKEFVDADTYGQIKGITNKEIDGLNIFLNNLVVGEKIAPKYFKSKDEGTLQLNESLGDIIESKELFDAYPQLKDMPVEISLQSYSSKNPKRGLGVSGSFVYGEITLRTPINTKTPKESLAKHEERIKSALLHEVQHAIQEIEGFATGGNYKMFQSELDTLKFGNVNALYSFAMDIAESNPEKGWDITYSSDAVKKYEQIFNEKPTPTTVTLASLLSQELSSGKSLQETKVYKTLKDNNLDPFERYQRLAGEVESRNVQERMGMTQKERQETLLKETEDVAREDQILLEGTQSKIKLQKAQKKPKLQARTIRLAPNGKRSNLTDVQYDLVRSPKFTSWFGDWKNDPSNSSKIVDENGEPMVVYHGTPDGSFDVFKEDAHFTADKKYAEGYQETYASSAGLAKDKVAPVTFEVFLNIKRPFDTREKNNADVFNSEYYKKWGMGTPLMESGLPDWNDSRDLLEWIEEESKPYDGILLDEGSTPDLVSEGKSRWVSYVPTDSNQIKLADGSNVEFGKSKSIKLQKASTQKVKKAEAEKSLKETIEGFKEEIVNGDIKPYYFLDEAIDLGLSADQLQTIFDKVAKETTKAQPISKKSPKVKKTEYDVLLDKYKALKQGIRSGQAELKRFLEGADREVQEIIKSIPKAESLTGSEMRTALVRMKNAGKEDVSKAIEFVEKTIRKKKYGKIKDLYDFAKKKAATKPKGKSREAKSTNVDGQSFFKQAARVLKAVKDGDMESLLDMMNELSENDELISDAIEKDSKGEKLSTKQKELLNLAYAVDNFADLTSDKYSYEHIMAIHEDFKTAAKLSALQLKESRAARTQKNKDIRDNAEKFTKDNFTYLYDEDGNLKTKTTDRDVQDAREKLGLPKRIKAWFKEFKEKPLTSALVKNIMHNRALLEVVDKKSKFLVDNIQNKLDRMYEKGKKLYYNDHDYVNNLINDITGTKDGVLGLRKKLGSEKIGIKKSNGKTVYRTKSEMMRILALSKNELQREKLENQGYSEDVLNDMMGHIGPEGVTLVDKIVDFLSNEHYEGVNDVFKRNNHINLPRIENYFPTATEATQTLGKDVEVGNGNFGNTFNAQTASSLKNRIDKNNELIEATKDGGLDFFSVLDNHFEETSHYKAYADGVKDISAVFSSKPLEKLFADLGLSKTLRQGVDFAVNEHAHTNNIPSWHDKFLGKFTSYVLAFKPIQVVKQATSFINAYEEYSLRGEGKQTPVIDMLGFAADFAKVLATLPKQIKEAKEISATFRDRLEKTNVAELMGGRHGRSMQKTEGKVSKAASFFTRAGDIMGVLGYKANYNRDIANGMSPEKALEKFNNYNVTQQSRRGQDMTPIQRERNFITRTATAFMSTSFLMINKAYSSGSKIMTGNAKVKDYRAFALSLGAANTLFTLASNMFKLGMGDDEDKEEVYIDLGKAASGLKMLTALPIIGDLVDDLANNYAVPGVYSVLGRKAPKKQGFFGGGGVNPYTRTFFEVKKAFKDDSTGEDWFNATNSLQGLITGLNFNALKGIYKLTEEDEDNFDGAMDMMGVTKSYQPGEKKKKKKKKKTSKGFGGGFGGGFGKGF